MLEIRRWMLVGVTIFLSFPTLVYWAVASLTSVDDRSLALTAALLTLLFALLFVGRQMGRGVVRPLEAIVVAARRIASGDLDVDLPQSQVREVAEATDAFRAMRDRLKESIVRQRQLEEERRFFIGAIAHDLRTPLFALRGYLVGLEQGLASSPEKTAEYIAVCRQKADQLERLVADLSAYAKSEQLEQTLRRERLELGAVLLRAVEGLRPQATGKGVALELDGPPEACVLEGDEHLLGRAVENLLDNALRYTPGGGRISVSWHREGDRATFSVADTGPGIAPADLPHLFDPLYKGETSRNVQTGGSGLGLTIARRIMRAHGGDLVAANRAAGGAEFTAWLPLRPEKPSAGQTAEVSSESGLPSD